MYLDQQLTKWKRFSRSNVRLQDLGEHIEFPSFQIDFEYVDVAMFYAASEVRTRGIATGPYCLFPSTF